MEHLNKLFDVNQNSYINYETINFNYLYIRKSLYIFFIYVPISLILRKVIYLEE